DPADAPAEHAEAVHHRRVGVRADQRVRVELRRGAVLSLEREDDTGQVLEVDLVYDAGARRHDAEVLERLLSPAQEGVALAVAAVLHVDVVAERHARTEL